MAQRQLPQASSNLIASNATAAEAPTWAKLDPLFGGLTGSPIIVSNNPEGPSGEGLLFSTEQNPLPKDKAGKFQRRLSNVNYVSGLPPGTLRTFTFYMHHLNQLKTQARVHVFVEAAGANAAQVNALGVAVSQMDTGTLAPGQSPSYRVSEALLGGGLSVGDGAGSQIVSWQGKTIEGGKYAVLANLSAGAGHSVDARIKVSSTNGVPLKVRVVVTKNKSAAEAYALSKVQFATGNIQCPCCRTAAAWGTPTGVYQYDSWHGTLDVSVKQPTMIRGWRFDTAPGNKIEKRQVVKKEICVYEDFCVPADGTPLGHGNNQRPAALGYYSWNNLSSFRLGGKLINSNHRDSDAFSTAMYGGEYLLTFRVRNDSASCVNARLRFASYPGTKHPKDVKEGPSRLWDGAFSVQINQDPKKIVRVFTKHTGPMYVDLGSKKLKPGESATIQIRTFVPGLISAPGALLLSTSPCQGQQA
ncbi:MAG: hypothetical protein IPK82_42550 [Polyangiaceae bacterium]|nr:hypothetical protein [Polyangiaceae bacterium]